MGKKKKIWRTDEERRAWEAHVDESIRTMRELVLKARAELAQKRSAG
jgi:hypothetical protein